MKLFGFGRARAEQRSVNLENPDVPVTPENFMAFFLGEGVGAAQLPRVTVESALTVPAIVAAVAFLSRTLAAIPLHGYRRTEGGREKLTGRLQMLIHDTPNPEMGSFKFRQYFWQQVFTEGRGLAYITRSDSGALESIWPFPASQATITGDAFGRLRYKFDGRTYAAEEVIDVPFIMKDMVRHRSPIVMASRAIQLALAMNEFGSTFFAGGGIPPLALTGPMPANAEAVKRQLIDVHRAIDEAKRSGKPLFPLPPGYKLEAVGLDPAKGQMTEARRFQVEEFSRVYQLPPVFLQNLERATFNNVEQQDLHLVKHLIGQWAAAFEDEFNLKVWGRDNRSRYVEHNLDGLLRGDFKSRIDGYAQAIQTAQMTPDEAREKENRPKHKNPAASELLVQGATVVLK